MAKTIIEEIKGFEFEREGSRKAFYLDNPAP
jgi:hypothetical protein